MKQASITPKGSLEVICGPMFSGKSEELIRRLRRALIAKQRVKAFKHSFDNQRSSDEYITSHSGITLTALATTQENMIRHASLDDQATVIGIDEVQFFDESIIHVIQELVDAGKRVIVAGLDKDHTRAPFGPMASLLAIADDVTKLKAICTDCGSDASLTQRLIQDPTVGLIQIGDAESYHARCRSCYIVPQML